MIELPQRSVTRFFIPLVDVMMLLFCIFLLMPIMKESPREEGEAGGALDRDELLNATESQGREIALLRGQLAQFKPEADIARAQAQLQDLEKEKLDMLKLLQQLKKEKIDTLQSKLAIRVLEVDDKTGALIHYRPGAPPKREVVGATITAKALIQEHKKQAASRELYYLFVYPRRGLYPTAEQDKLYSEWFQDVPYGVDDPLSAKQY